MRVSVGVELRLEVRVGSVEVDMMERVRVLLVLRVGMDRRNPRWTPWRMRMLLSMRWVVGLVVEVEMFPRGFVRMGNNMLLSC